MNTDAGILAETAHTLTRKGRDLQVRVQELPAECDGGYLLVFGEPGAGCLVRVHSRCLYGDALRSDDCDCGPELDMAMDMIQDEGSGVLVYLEQEGRGVGLIAKARGLRRTELSGEDTFTSYHSLGYPEDARCYKLAARALADLLSGAFGVDSVRLLTNNPDKVQALESAGLAVRPVPLGTQARSERARKYLEAKRRHRRHWIPLEAALQDTATLEPLSLDAPWDEQTAAAAPELPRWRSWLRKKNPATTGPTA
ncbi:GTP cyclohydrolase II RibA [Nocardia goodfellowii]|uniref:3,4-dihydroxy 2-butanone 4-phosphate synthase/GTP cyclohydrolase II n=1 Tax=Nocardia goodfellowii TaxID=882446 RepID=A0ABS4QJT8_9NOCA|nr:GTP cyclohydrolase II RibA [Nocardia goodfellowii]MBP2191848.1 3,4-dihydroxy 2-butanone 4-phosphate synthase/GTP cyclohydrolase II [Nocardia goodfellowii]